METALDAKQAVEIFDSAIEQADSLRSELGILRSRIAFSLEDNSGEESISSGEKARDLLS